MRAADEIIDEGHFIGKALGEGMNGYRPIVELMNSNFGICKNAIFLIDKTVILEKKNRWNGGDKQCREHLCYNWRTVSDASNNNRCGWNSSESGSWEKSTDLNLSEVNKICPGSRR